MQRYLSNATPIRLPVHSYEQLRRINNYIASYSALNGDNPSVDIISRALNIEVDRVNEILIASKYVISIDSPISEEDDENTLKDFIIDEVTNVEDDVLHRQMFIYYLDLMEKILTNRQLTVVKLRLGLEKGFLPMTLEEVGEIMGITRERVRQIEAKAYRKVRDYIKYSNAQEERNVKSKKKY